MGIVFKTLCKSSKNWEIKKIPLSKFSLSILRFTEDSTLNRVVPTAFTVGGSCRDRTKIVKLEISMNIHGNVNDI